MIPSPEDEVRLTGGIGECKDVCFTLSSLMGGCHVRVQSYRTGGMTGGIGSVCLTLSSLMGCVREKKHHLLRVLLLVIRHSLGDSTLGESGRPRFREPSLGDRREVFGGGKPCRLARALQGRKVL